MRAVRASSFHDGSLLEQLAREIGDCDGAGGDVLPFGGAGATLEMYWASICSGSEVVLFVLLSIATYYQSRGVNVIFKHRFSCECKPAKQQWIHGLFDELGMEQACVFVRAEDLNQPRAYCCTHRRKCPVPDCDIMIAGTSCKDFSKASSNRRNLSPADVLKQESTPGGSAQTMRALLQYVSHHCVAILLLENSDNLDEASPVSRSTQTALDMVVDAIRRCGMAPCPLLTDSLLYGIPQERRRFYIVAVKDSGSMLFDFAMRPAATVFAMLKERLTQHQRQAPCLSELLLATDDDCVEAMLNARLAKGVREGHYNVSAVAKTYKAGGIRWGDAELNTDLPAKIWYGTLAPSAQATLKYSRAEKPSGQVLCRDISQSVARVRYSKFVDGRHVAMCQCPEQVVWLELPGKEPRLQLGLESMAIQGFPISKVPRLVQRTSDHMLMDLGGNMMASVLPLAILQSLFVSLAWRPKACTLQRPLAMSEGAVAIAMSSFHTMISENDEAVEQPCRAVKLRRRGAPS